VFRWHGVLTTITVLAKGDTVEYIIPSFPPFSARLTEVKLQYESDEGLMVFDGFARHCEALDHPLYVFPITTTVRLLLRFVNVTTTTGVNTLCLPALIRIYYFTLH